MRCVRCSGLVIPERIYAAEAVFEGYKCITCGEAFDDVVLHNRHEGLNAPPVSKRPAQRSASSGR